MQYQIFSICENRTVVRERRVPFEISSQETDITRERVMQVVMALRAKANTRKYDFLKFRTPRKGLGFYVCFNDLGRRCFLIIEEPEAHIYPLLQKRVMEFIVFFVNIQDSGVDHKA